MDEITSSTAPTQKSTSGRRLVRFSSEVLAAGVRTALASGVFTSVGGEKFEAFDRARRERQGRRPA